jgi:RNA-binding protein
MITTKQRAKLKSIANNIIPVVQIGKEGITDNLISGLNLVLDARELIKINVLKTSTVNSKDMCKTLCEKLSADPVLVIGNKVIIYRKSKREDVKHISLD